MKDKKLQFGFKVEFITNCEYERTQHGDHAYDYSWSSDCSNRLKEVSKTKEYPDVTCEFDLQIGDVGYLVWAEWSNGDSFGRGNRNSVDSFGLFKDRDSATAFANELKTSPDRDAKGNRLLNLPWHGYFENLDEIHVEGVTIY